MSSSNDQPKVIDERITRSENSLPPINTIAERSIDSSKQNGEHPSDESLLKKIDEIQENVSSEKLSTDPSNNLKLIPKLVEQILKNNNVRVKIKVY